MPDYGDEEFHQMICIEAANAGADTRIAYPGISHTLAQKITVL
jgi:glucose-6-phosphate 1-epimerase